MKMVFLMLALSPTDQHIEDSVIYSDHLGDYECRFAQMELNTLLYSEGYGHSFCVDAATLLKLRMGDVGG